MRRAPRTRSLRKRLRDTLTRPASEEGAVANPLFGLAKTIPASHRVTLSGARNSIASCASPLGAARKVRSYRFR